MAEIPNCLHNNCSSSWTQHSFYPGQQYPQLRMASPSLYCTRRVMWPSSSQWDARSSQWVWLCGKLFKEHAAAARAVCRDAREVGPYWSWGAFTPAPDCPPLKIVMSRKMKTLIHFNPLLGCLCKSQLKAMIKQYFCLFLPRPPPSTTFIVCVTSKTTGRSPPIQTRCSVINLRQKSGTGHWHGAFPNLWITRPSQEACREWYGRLFVSTVPTAPAESDQESCPSLVQVTPIKEFQSCRLLDCLAHSPIWNTAS